MAILNFQLQFAERVETGKKTCTIRATRKQPVVIGEMLYLYTGLRSKHARKLLETKCTDHAEIHIEENRIWLSNQVLNSSDIFKLAQLDGFPSSAALFDFFRETHGFPFYGQWIRWEFPEK